MFEILNRYVRDKGTFQATFTGVETTVVHPTMLNVEDGKALLFEDLYDVEQNQYVGKWCWLNLNRSWLKAAPRPGDRVEFMSNSTLYHLGRNYHKLNIRRPIRDLWRLVYPTKISIIDTDEDYINPIYRPIIDLRTNIVHDTFFKYLEANDVRQPFTERKELLFIELIDNHYPQCLFNRNGFIVNDKYPPQLMYLEDYNNLTDSQRKEVDRVRMSKISMF